VEELAQMSGLMSAMISGMFGMFITFLELSLTINAGGEAEPVFPTFDKVLLVSGQIKRPKRILPVHGLGGEELWASEEGVQLGLVVPDELPHDKVIGKAKEVVFNWMTDKQHLEGGRYMMKEKKNVENVVVNKQKRKRQTLKVNKRIPQNIILTSDEDEGDTDYLPLGNIAVPKSDRNKRSKKSD
jgi:hypothetical protein